jgi:D-3-phosphoglycerate dehydrogenase
MTETGSRGKVAVLNFSHDLSLERALLAEAGLELVPAQCHTEDEVIAAAHDAVAIINVYARITARVAAHLKRCRVIARPGVGYDMIDVAACRAHGIQVCHVPDYCTEEVADHAVALLLALQRRLLEYRDRTRAGHWDPPLRPVRRLRTQTLGLLGFGRIGQRVAAKMREIAGPILAHDPFVPGEVFARERVERVPLDELLARADILSLHSPLTPQTRHVISRASIARMVRRPIIINVSRGGLIDTTALVEALLTGAITAAGLDVLETEPQIPQELVALDNVLITPHVAWYSEEAEEEDRRRTAEEIIRVVVHGEPPRNPVP